VDRIEAKVASAVGKPCADAGRAGAPDLGDAAFPPGRYDSRHAANGCGAKGSPA
jgi:hypothetical protein